MILVMKKDNTRASEMSLEKVYSRFQISQEQLTNLIDSGDALEREDGTWFFDYPLDC